MTRGTVAVDRILVSLTGLTLIAAGVAAFMWSRGDLAAAQPLQVAAPVGDVESSWWPWSVGGIGLVLVLIGLWWLSAHRRTPRVRTITLADDGPDEGALSADAASVASAAASALAQNALVHRASARSSIEKGEPTITLTAHIPPRRALRAVGDAADEVATTASAMLGDAVAIRTRIRVDGRGRSTAVV